MRRRRIEFSIHTTNADLVAQAEEQFQKHGGAQMYDGFEVWAGSQFVYRFSAEKQEQQTE